MENYIKNNVILQLEILGDEISIVMWESIIIYNEVLKVVVVLLVGFFFYGNGVIYEEFIIIEVSVEVIIGLEFEVRVGINMVNGGIVVGLGVVIEMDFGFIIGGCIEIFVVLFIFNIVGYVLVDDDVFDNINVLVIRDLFYMMLVFKLFSGQIFCLYELNMQYWEEVQLQANIMIVINVEVDEGVFFNLLFGNVAFFGDIGFYILVFVLESNFNGVVLLLNGDGLVGDGEVYIIFVGESILVILIIEWGLEVYIYEGIRVVLFLQCEYERVVFLGMFWEQIDFKFYWELEFNVYFWEFCSEVQIIDLGEGWVIIFNDNNELKFIFEGYDVDEESFEFICV